MTAFPDAYIVPWHTLTIGDPYMRAMVLPDLDYMELMDAAHEDADGRLPHAPGCTCAGCGGTPQLELVSVPRRPRRARLRVPRRPLCGLAQDPLWVGAP